MDLALLAVWDAENIDDKVGAIDDKAGALVVVEGVGFLIEIEGEGDSLEKVEPYPNAL